MVASAIASMRIEKHNPALKLLGGFIFGILATTGAPGQETMQTAEPLPAERSVAEEPGDMVAKLTPASGALPLIQRAPAVAPIDEDPCLDADIEPNSMSPTWNLQAGTVQCGSLETDNLVSLQPLEGGLAQFTLGTTAKYGLTPRLEVRWALPGRIFQQGGGVPAITGTTDQLFGILYHFHNHTAWTPDLSVSYAVKLPTANPAKGFGSGYTDHLFTLVASRDAGSNHVDFNVSSTVAGGGGGRDGATQFGIGFSHTFPHNLMATLEAFGGPQPFSDDRYGAAFAGGSWGIRPWLALNGGCIRSYTAGSAPAQYLMGFIYTRRPRFAPPHASRFAHLLGR